MARTHQRESLYQLQSRWDDERAAQRIRELRGMVRSDLRWLPLIAGTLPLLVTAAAALSRNLPA